MLEIDRDLLPQRACVDTDVLILGLGKSRRDPRAEVCRAFFDAMEKENRRILVTTPTLAEYLRRDGRELPRRGRTIVIVAFDQPAATLLADKVPSAFIKQAQKDLKLFQAYVKFDALIAACAARHRADHMVAFDPRTKASAAKCGLKVCEPEDYTARQRRLPAVELQPPPPPKPRPT